MSKLIFAFIVGFFIVASCKKEEPSIPISTGTISTGLSNRVISHDGVDREYLIYVPEGIQSTDNPALLFNFHGYGGTSVDHMNAADMRSLADRDKFILVYPQGTELSGAPHWNCSDPSSSNKSSVDDIGFIRSLIDTLAMSVNIDRNRVYACGYSNGSFFSFYLACQLSDKIAAIGSVSGTMLDDSYTGCNATHQMPVILIHGTSDGVVPYNGGTGYTSMVNIVDYWKNYNSTDAQGDTITYSTGGNSVDYISFPNGNNGSTVEHYKVNGSNHVWLNITKDGKDINEIIWDYFNRYDIDGLR